MFSVGESRIDLSPFIISDPSYAETDPRCEWCERSLVTRFGSEQAAYICESCEADHQREYDAAGGMIEVAP